ncbi:ABC transporter substrate-binding protein [Chlamydia trachomatis]|uniref:amino acid ABC transporter substrate-binding protein n=1 Tax=Chlamydia trachomatis TaxID=813 RepID=UPI0007DD0258|nr:transporter substrate-binding domain-containing protein [Chlamydia trachomatis]ANI65708.1 ABC transporter substrate-binding protein [Chlamydia trachomatis]
MIRGSSLISEVRVKFKYLRPLSFLVLVIVAFCYGCSREKQEILVGRDATWFPQQFGIYTSGINAFVNDLVSEINYKEGLNISIVNQDWVHLFENLDDKKTSGVFTSASPSIEMLARYQFSDPVLLTGPVLVVLENSPYHSLQDLEGKLIGVYKFDSSVLIAQNVPNAVIDSYQHIPVALEALSTQRYDALLVPVIEATALVETAYKGRLRIASEPLNEEGLRLVVLRGGGSDSLLEGFNAGLAKIRRSGRYKAIKMQSRLP